MTPRLTTAIRVGALIRRVNAAGGSAMVLAKGDETSGAMLIWAEEPGGVAAMVEAGFEGGMIRVGPGATSGETLTAYWNRRRDIDPDLWIIELIVAGAERFAAETIAPN